MVDRSERGDMKMDLERKVKFLMARENINQKELAKKLTKIKKRSVSEAAVSAMLKSQNPNVKTIRALAVALDCDIKYFFQPEL